MFGPYRGPPPADTEALADLMVALSQFAADHADAIAEIDLNPVIVHAQGQGVSVVDALIVKRETRRPNAAARPSSDKRRTLAMGPFKDIGVEKTGHVALVEIRRPPNNFFDIALIKEIAKPSRRSTLTPTAARWCWRRKARRFAPAPISAMATATAARC